MISTSRKALSALGLAVGGALSFVNVSLADEPARPAAKIEKPAAGPSVLSVSTRSGQSVAGHGAQTPASSTGAVAATPTTPAATVSQPVAYTQGWSGGMPVPEDRTYLQVDALWLQRNRSGNFNVATTGAAGTGAIVLDLYDVENFQSEIGPKITFGYLMDNESAVEATYWGTHFWSQSAAAAGPVSSIFLNSTPDNLFDVGIREQGSTRIHNAELNLRRNASHSPGFHAQGVFGFRFMNLEDAYEITGADAANAITGEANANTNNYLFGLQVGADFSHCIFTPAFRVGTGVRGGLFVNYIDSDLRNRATGPTGAVTTFANFGDQTTNLAGLLEWNFQMSLKVTKNLLVRGGYQMTYVPGVAIASESLFSAGVTANGGLPIGGVGGAAIDRNGDIFVHGPFLGGEFRF